MIVTLAGKLTGSRHRTQKFIQGHIKYCGETAIEHMDRGYAVAVKKLRTIGVTVAIMRPEPLPHSDDVQRCGPRPTPGKPRWATTPVPTTERGRDRRSQP